MDTKPEIIADQQPRQPDPEPDLDPDTGAASSPLPPTPSSSPAPMAKRGFHFWAIFACLCVLAFVSALDVAIITTALPTIVAEIGGATQYVWIANSFVVASCVVQPLFGKLADVLGRRVPLMASVALFIVGSGVGGGATGPGMLIAGRTVQGAGAGGIYVLLDIVCCDLVPMRERGKYLGLMFSWSGVAAALGPPVGGAIAESNWRWIFYLNIPLCGVVMIGLLFFMRVKTGASASAPVQSSTTSPSTGASGTTPNRFKHLFSRLDVLGNLIFIPSMVALLWGVVMGGVEYSWSSWRIIVPLVLGILGWIAFHVQQAYFAKYPSVPPRMFANRTSATAFVLTFTSSIIVQAVTYFFPVYLQAVKGTTALDSGTFFLPFALPSLVFAVAGGILLSKTGAYRPIHAASFAITALALGLFTMLDEGTSKAVWVIFEIIASVGVGIIMPVLLPAIMAALPEGDVAVSSAAYSFIRTFGYIWGVTLSSIVFNAVFDNNLNDISDTSLHPQLEGGAAYAFASQMHGLRKNGAVEDHVLDEIARVFVKSLRAIWWVGLGFSIASFFAVGLERGLELRTELDTEYGLDEKSKQADAEQNVVVTGSEK
jgi:MFS family permease